MADAPLTFDEYIKNEICLEILALLAHYEISLNDIAANTAYNNICDLLSKLEAKRLSDG